MEQRQGAVCAAATGCAGPMARPYKSPPPREPPFGHSGNGGARPDLHCLGPMVEAAGSG